MQRRAAKQWPGDSVTNRGKNKAKQSRRGARMCTTIVAGRPNAVQHANNTTGGEEALLMVRIGAATFGRGAVAAH